MGSSFAHQIPVIIHLVQKLKCKRILDVGKGFGKYGFLIHEYCGIDNQRKINNEQTLKEQSAIRIDAAEIDADLMLPHLSQIYHEVYIGDIFESYERLEDYDLILMIDVIEHLDKEKSISMLNYFLKKNTSIIISTPLKFFEQHLYESVYENHVSFWSISDFKKLGNVDVQKIDGGAIYLLSSQKMNIRGYGAGLIKKIRRIAKAVINEL